MAYYEGQITDLGGGNSNSWGQDGWWIIVFLIFALGGWGNNYGGGATPNIDSSLQRGFDTQTINAKLNDIGNGISDSTYAVNNGISGIQQTLCQGFGGVNTGMVQQGYETRLGINAIGAQLANCCCDLQSQIKDVNYSIATQTNALQQALCTSTRDIIDSQREGTASILSFLTNEKISSLQAQNSQLLAQLSQANQTANIINAIRPCPTPSYIVPNPFCCNATTTTVTPSTT